LGSVNIKRLKRNASNTYNYSFLLCHNPLSASVFLKIESLLQNLLELQMTISQNLPPPLKIKKINKRLGRLFEATLRYLCILRRLDLDIT